jgi:hypothetical protein
VTDYFGSLEGSVDMSQNYLDVCDSLNKILSPAKIREFRSMAFSVADGKALEIDIAILSPISVQNCFLQDVGQLLRFVFELSL